jgi:xanthine dehydrogenase accessory factor
MTARTRIAVEAGRLAEEGRPFALATVVRVVRPASARMGDRALITPEGAVHGWVGGACSEPAVVREALRALADGEPRLLQVCRPGGAGAVPPGVVVAESACASEGAVEVLIEPHLPDPLLVVLGDSPAAATLAELAPRVGWRVASGLQPEAKAIVIASMGRGDAETLQAALETKAGYVGLVASARRGAATIASLRELGVDEEKLARVRCPAGLDLGPCSQEEIAVAVLAELVAWRHARAGEPGEMIAAPVEAVDPVCGMTVAVTGETETLVYADVRYYFCCSGCRRRFEQDPTRYLTEVSSS